MFFTANDSCFSIPIPQPNLPKQSSLPCRQSVFDNSPRIFEQMEVFQAKIGQIALANDRPHLKIIYYNVQYIFVTHTDLSPSWLAKCSSIVLDLIEYCLLSFYGEQKKLQNIICFTLNFFNVK